MPEFGKSIKFDREDSYFKQCIPPNNLILKSYLNNFMVQNPPPFREVFICNRKLCVHDEEEKKKPLKIFGRSNHTLSKNKVFVGFSNPDLLVNYIYIANPRTLPEYLKDLGVRSLWLWSWASSR